MPLYTNFKQFFPQGFPVVKALSHGFCSCGVAHSVFTRTPVVGEIHLELLNRLGASGKKKKCTYTVACVHGESDAGVPSATQSS